MPSTLSSLGTISYNGFTFQGPMRPRTSLTVKPQYDSAQRVVSYNIYTIGVTFYATSDPSGIGGGSDAGPVTADMSAKLTRPGGILIATGLGYPGLNINTGVQSRDVLYGPKPRFVNFNPIGANLVIEVQWECEIAIAQCANNDVIQGQLGLLSEMIFTTDDTIDRQGMARRAINGHYVIALNRATPAGADAGGGAQTIAQTADDFRNLIAPIPPLGFEQVSQHWQLSEDKSRMDFAIVQQELPSDNAPPNFTSEIDMDHSVESRLAKDGFIQFNSVLDGHIEVTKDLSTSQALYYAILILRDRIAAVRNNGFNAIIHFIRFVERGTFRGRRIDFQFQYYNLGKKGVDLKDIVTASGVTFPISFTDWGNWRQSMFDGNAWSQRGSAQLAFNASNDQLIDLCNQSTPQQSISGTTPSPGSYTDPGSLSNSDVQRSQSYIDWKNHVGVDTNGNTIQHYPLPTQPPAQSGGSGNYGSGGTGNPDGIGAAVPSSNTSTGADAIPKYDNNQPQPIQQSSGAQKMVLTMAGYGTRAGFPVELPMLVSTIGQQAAFQPQWSSVSHTAYQGYGGVTIYQAAWVLRYLVAGNPSTINGVMTDDIANYVTGTTDGG